MRPSKILLVAVLLTPAAADAQVTIRPGQYEYTIDMRMAVPKEAEKAVLDAAGFQGQKRLECITADEARQAKEDVVKFFAKEMDMEECKMSDAKVIGNRLTFNSVCKEDGVQMVVSTETTFGVDTFSSVGKMKDGDGRMSTMTMSARRVGECK